MLKVKVLDGGFSGQLSRHVGAKIDGDPLWTARFLATNPDAVYATHLDFLRAGADIIETNTYQASVPGIMEHLKLSYPDSMRLIKEAVLLAKKAVDTYLNETNRRIHKTPLIAGSCGPYGAYLHDSSEYSGSYREMMSEQDLMNWHRPRIQALLDAEVDLLAFETIPCIQEANALIALLREIPHARAWISFSCRDGQFMADGSEFQKVAMHCYQTLPNQIVAVGVNCIDPKYVTPLLEGINQESLQNFIPLIAYPNRGGSYSNGRWTAVPDDHALNLPISEWIKMGVSYIGGCCKIFAEDITTIHSEVIREYESKI